MINKQFAAKALHYIELFGIITTLALLPIDRFPYLHTVPLRLGLVSLVCLIIATCFRLYQLYKARDLKLKKLLLVAAVLTLPFIAYGLSVTYAIDSKQALSATYLFGLGITRAFAFCVLLSTNVQLRRISEKTIYIVTAVVVAFGLFQFFFDVFGAHTIITDLKSCCTSNSTYVFPRVHSTALEPLYFDHYLMIPIWLLTFRFLRNKKSRSDKRLIVLFVATTTLFILTVARSATIGLIFASTIFIIALWKTEGFKRFLVYASKLWGAAILLTILFVGVSGIAANFIDKTAQYAPRGLGSISLFGSHAIDFDDGSSKTRYELWPKAIGYFKEEPLTGVGADNSRIRLNREEYNKGVETKKLQPFNNDAIGYIVEFGLLGISLILPLLILLVYVVRHNFKQKLAHWATPFVFVLIGMAVQSNFFHSVLLTRTWFVIGMLLFIYVSPETDSSKITRVKKI